jgi:hypothetical protein
MAATLFKDATYPVRRLVEDIERGSIALPDIQRPFVWHASKVRSLFDSMYRGFPVGFLLFWETGADPGARQIGSGDAAPRLLIVDGQQRLTSLFAVMTGSDVLREDYTKTRIRIAFRPTDGTFAVTDAAIEKDAEFIPDISVLWEPGRRKSVVRKFLQRLAEKRGYLSEDEQDRLDDAIDQLYDLQNYNFKAMELTPEADEEQVAEIFVRINSEGVTLNQADFILTLMSVFWEKGRRELEAFCQQTKQPAPSGPSPFNWHIQPQPPQLLRVTVALAFRRAVLKNVYTLLRGRDVETGRPSPERREEQFARLQYAQEQVLDLTNWHEFLQCLERAGFRGKRMISSENAILFSYAMWLIGRIDFNVPIDRLREVIARWFFMAHTTGRYSGTFESRGEQDFARLRDAKDAEEFCRTIDGIIDSTFTSDYWTITLPNELGTSAAKSPALLAYYAALNILDADALLSVTKIRARLDPAVTAKKGIERHHLFPRNHIRTKLGISDSKQINQIANMALVEWSDNIKISDKAPSEYWPEEVAARGISPERLARQCYLHALPEGWQHMPYRAFLETRRKLMAQVINDAFTLLRDSSYEPEYPKPAGSPPKPSRAHVGVKLADLLNAGLVSPATVLINAQEGSDSTALVLEDGRILLNGEVHDTPSGAGKALAESSVNGWEYWSADTPDGLRTLASLREEYLARDAGQVTP